MSGIGDSGETGIEDRNLKPESETGTLGNTRRTFLSTMYQINLVPRSLWRVRLNPNFTYLLSPVYPPAHPTSDQTEAKVMHT